MISTKRLKTIQFWRRVVGSLIIVFALLCAVVLGMAGDELVKLDPVVRGEHSLTGSVAVLKVMTANAAHGRADGPNQLFLDEPLIRDNLFHLGQVISAQQPHVVAFQEIDSPSFWSERINQLEVVCAAAPLNYSIQGHHVDGLGLHYGAGIASLLPMDNCLSRTFKPTPPVFSKGFVVSRFGWFDEGFEFDVISCHLDFSSIANRRDQLKTLTEFMQERDIPIIVMGDFNTLSDDDHKLLIEFMESNELTTYQPEQKEIVTFPMLDVRLDWILVSKEFEIVSHRVLPEVISDHRAVVCEIVRR